MSREWNNHQPIYRQLRDRVVAMILDGALKEGDPLPSVRTVAAEYRVNPLTVLKAYQELADEELVESPPRTGHVRQDRRARSSAQGEREKFLTEEWPRIAAMIERLGLTRRNSGRQTTDAGNRSPKSEKQESQNLIHGVCIEARRPPQGLCRSTDGIWTGSTCASKEGRILGLIGPNGAGKTTVLNAILGLTLRRPLKVLGRDPWARAIN